MRRAGRPGADVSSCRLQVHGCAREQRVWLKPRGCPMRWIHLPRAALFVSDHLTGARGSFRSSGCTRTTPGEAPAAPRRAAQHRAERPPTGRASCFGVCGLCASRKGGRQRRGCNTALSPHTRPQQLVPTSRRPALLSLPPARPAASRTRAPNSPHVCPSHCTDQRGGPNASTDADQLVARRSSDSAMDGGREERPEAAEASPNPPSIMPKQPGSGQPLGQLVEAADRSSAGKWPGESVRGAGPARSQ